MFDMAVTYVVAVLVEASNKMDRFVTDLVADTDGKSYHYCGFYWCIHLPAINALEAVSPL